MHQIGGEIGQALQMSVCITILDRDVLVAVAERAQPLPERPKGWLHQRARSGVKKGDPAALRWLRAGGVRQQQRPGGGKDEAARRRCAGGHSITSSARATQHREKFYI